MFFNKPKISRTWKSDSGTGYSIKDDAGRTVVLWFDPGSDDFITAKAGAGPLMIVHDSDPLAQRIAATREASAGLQLAAGGVLGNLFGGRG